MLLSLKTVFHYSEQIMHYFNYLILWTLCNFMKKHHKQYCFSYSHTFLQLFYLFFTTHLTFPLLFFSPLLTIHAIYFSSPLLCLLIPSSTSISFTGKYALNMLLLYVVHDFFRKVVDFACPACTSRWWWLHQFDQNILSSWFWIELYAGPMGMKELNLNEWMWLFVQYKIALHLG